MSTKNPEKTIHYQSVSALLDFSQATEPNRFPGPHGKPIINLSTLKFRADLINNEIQKQLDEIRQSLKLTSYGKIIEIISHDVFYIGDYWILSVIVKIEDE